MPPLVHAVMQLEPMQNFGAVTLFATLKAPAAVKVATSVPLHRPSAAVVPAQAVKKLNEPVVAVADSSRTMVPDSLELALKTARPVWDPVSSVIVNLL